MTRGPQHSGFEPRTRDPERRDFFDLRRRVAALEAGGGGGGSGGEEVFIGPSDPGLPYELWYDTDAPSKVATSLVGYAIGPFADQAGIGSTATNLTGMSVSFTADPTHLYLTHAVVFVTQRTAVGSFILWIANASSSAVRENRYGGLAINEQVSCDIMTIETGQTGAHTRKLMASTSAGTAEIEGSDGRFTPKMYVLDLGPV